MRKVELLAPAGDKESLIAAIQNGADAVYLGGSLFNARVFAKNFDLDDLKWAVEYAHIRKIKIYVTVNTLYKDSEFDDLIQYIDYLYDIQVDALIIQDLGLFNVVRNRYKDFEIHMSTQASVMNKYSAEYYRNYGASRVVLARENTLEEIKEIADYTDIELEVFVHGALCISYSGQCLMSSMIGKRSGNRGQCAQPCRLEYQLKKNNSLLDNHSTFLLSPKDLMTLDDIGRLIDAGVTSFKIEGRMKRPEYVGAAVKAYRKAIDNHMNLLKDDYSSEKDDMKQMFNRDYTKGYLFNDEYISDGLFSGNRGIIIGKVISYNKFKKRAVIKLSERLKQGDSILFESIDKGRPVNKIFIKDKLVNGGYKNDIIEVEFDYRVTNGNVRKTVDCDLIKKLQLTYNKEIKKNTVDFYFAGKLGEYAVLTLKFDDIEIICKSDMICDKALKSPLDRHRIESQLSKLGDTPFCVNKCYIDIDNNMILPIKTINDLRRKCIDELTNRLKEKKIHHNIKSSFELDNISFIENLKQIDIFVSNLQQLRECMKYPFRNVYFPYCKDVLEAIKICQMYNKSLALFIPRILKSNELDEILRSEAYQKVKKVVVNDMGSYNQMQEKEVILGTGLNIYNSYASQYCSRETILSLEMDSKMINSIKYKNIIVQIYGKPVNMISQFCPISQYYHGKQIKKCNKCKNDSYFLVDRKNEEFPIMTDEQCRMHLLNNKAIYFDNINSLKCNSFLLYFTNEDKEIDKILEDYFINIIRGNKSTIKYNMKYTNGYLQ